ncbi:MAG: hypothetical protein ACJATN_001783 [Neolewinella sp.]
MFDHGGEESFVLERSRGRAVAGAHQIRCGTQDAIVNLFLVKMSLSLIPFTGYAMFIIVKPKHTYEKYSLSSPDLFASTVYQLWPIQAG